MVFIINSVCVRSITQKQVSSASVNFVTSKLIAIIYFENCQTLSQLAKNKVLNIKNIECISCLNFAQHRCSMNDLYYSLKKVSAIWSVP
jgi:hypothetical protein